MASQAAPVTRASGGGQGGGGEKKIMGLNRSTVFIVGGAALGLGLLYFYMQGKKTQGQGQGQGQGKARPPASPTGLTREDIHIWINDHGRAGGKRHG